MSQNCSEGRLSVTCTRACMSIGSVRRWMSELGSGDALRRELLEYMAGSSLNTRGPARGCKPVFKLSPKPVLMIEALGADGCGCLASPPPP